MPEQTLIECPDCESKVSAVVLAKREYVQTDDYDPFIVYFLECPICHRTMVGHSDLMQIEVDKWDYTKPSRLWPNSSKNLDRSIPTLVRQSIEEARKCFGAKAYSACAVMCGRSIEAVCKEHGAKKWQLAQGLKELKDDGIIDGRLFEWGEALRNRRNIGAHASDENISREDASDILDFTIAICEYVYVLTQKYEEFKKREKKQQMAKKTT